MAFSQHSAPDRNFFVKWLKPALDMLRGRFVLSTLMGMGAIALSTRCAQPRPYMPQSSLNAGSTHYLIDHWQVQDGLPAQTIRAISITPDGYLWIGTSGGLTRFDGARFHTYSRQDVPALEDNSIDCLLTAKNGDLWIGTEGGGVVRLHQGVFQPLPRDVYPPSNIIRGLYQDSHGSILVATDGGLFQVQDDTNSLKNVNSPLHIPVFNVNAVMEDHLGRLWIGGALLLARDRGAVNMFPLYTDGNTSEVWSLHESRDGTIWAGTLAGLYRLPPGGSTFIHLKGVDFAVHALEEDEEGVLWAGTAGGGIYRIRGDRVIQQIAAPSSLLSNTVFSIRFDHDHSVWIGTHAGMMRLSRSAVRIVNLGGAMDSEFGTVTADQQGNLWVASDQLLGIRDHRAFPLRFPEITDVQTSSLLRGMDGSFWIGTLGKGVYREHAGVYTRYQTSNGLANNFVRTLTESRDGSMWVGTNNGASHLTSRGIETYTMNNGLSFYSIRSILEDRDGDVWIGTDHGLNRLHAGRFLSDPLCMALKNEKIWSLFQDAEGNLWVGTRGNGLYLSIRGTIRHFTTMDGLANDNIYSILGDNSDHLWLSSPTAVMLLSRSILTHAEHGSQFTLPLRVFPATIADKGAQLFGGMQPSGTLTADGEACFPSTHGLWIIHPDQARPSLSAQLRISNINVDGHSLPAGGSYVLPPGSNRLEIGYDLILLRSQGEVRFRYKLNGVDPDWIKADPAQRMAIYTNIPAGHYRFEVVSWETGHPSYQTRATVEFYKKPFFYQTLWFKILILLLLILLGWFAFFVRVHQLKSRFQAIITERARIAREIHDTLMQGCAGVSALLNAASDEDVGGDESRLHLIQYASTQIRTTIDEARDAVFNLRSSASGSVDLVASLSKMTERIARENGIELPFIFQGTPVALDAAATHTLEMVAREAIFNAVLHASPQIIRVTVEFNPETIFLAIADDGCGFNADAVCGEAHFGIQGMRERIIDFGGVFSIESAAGKGTTVHIRVPIKNRKHARANTPACHPPAAAG